MYHAAPGITPAYAGNTIFAVLFAKCVEGSPPPTRGTLIYNALQLASSRITPAYAGNTQGEVINELCDWDHPRLRGEHFSSSKLKPKR